MADIDKIRMQIEIAGQKIGITVGFDEQDAVREAESSVVELYNDWKKRFPKKSVTELLAMIAYQYASYYLTMRRRQTDAITQLSEIESCLDDVLNNAELKKDGSAKIEE